MKIDHSYEETQ